MEDYVTTSRAIEQRVFNEYSPAPGAVDARPILPRSPSSIWERTDQLRSALRICIEKACSDRQIDALVLESPPYVHPAWVKFESWIPTSDATVTRRSSMTVTITAMPYHRFEALYKVDWTWEGASGSVDQLHSFGADELVRVLQTITNERKRELRNASKALARTLRRSQVRQKGWQLWRAKNKIAMLRADHATTASIWLVLIGLYGVWSGLQSLMIDEGGLPTLAVSAILGLAGLGIWLAIRRTGRLVRSPGKPMAEPRNMRYLDSWQTVLFGAGNNVDMIRSQLMALFASTQLPRLLCTTERIWYWGLEGKEEREQIVLRYGRAIVFVQVYRYGADLFAGWDAQLNMGIWMEKQLASGVERQSGKRVDLMTVMHGSQVNTEYDLIDLNCVAEWTHAQITQVLKQYMKEKKIDQEIDFKIIRGERSGIGDKPEGEKKRRLFKRTG
jgi:hypothetical protein